MLLGDQRLEGTIPIPRHLDDHEPVRVLDCLPLREFWPFFLGWGTQGIAHMIGHLPLQSGIQQPLCHLLQHLLFTRQQQALWLSLNRKLLDELVISTAARTAPVAVVLASFSLVT